MMKSQHIEKPYSAHCNLFLMIVNIKGNLKEFYTFCDFYDGFLLSTNIMHFFEDVIRYFLEFLSFHEFICLFFFALQRESYIKLWKYILFYAVHTNTYYFKYVTYHWINFICAIFGKKRLFQCCLFSLKNKHTKIFTQFHDRYPLQKAQLKKKKKNEYV